MRDCISFSVVFKNETKFSLIMLSRTRLTHNGDDLISNMNGVRDDKEFQSEIQLYRIKPQDHFIEAQVQEGDTLQAIALRFHCSISELKRINQIHKDNEIFARRTIKVPVTPYSVLTEMIPAPQPQPPLPSTSNQVSTSLSMHNMLYQPVENNSPQKHNNNIQNGIETKEADFAIDCNTVVMNSSLAPSVTPYTDTEQNESISEDTQLLPSKTKVPVEAVVVKELTSHGADFGLKWYHLVCCLLILGVLTPLLYIMFYLDKHEHSDIPPLHPTR
ncbi:lysM and putative peptidoglycan-binding domain-containing protein 3 isoform X1 [Vanessa cardui]|uniref:lysM and putative peptidoglycan-binding domain-containing protein 3 isoform X1 n=1 Tax=Vanessa cardui TaxID=171605 RepID=UPI001F13A7B9|nr:lysM and putative peptidoglycan-binding domain-containing protein 3 isoform X1 [Vanessa cardui]